MNWKMVLAMTAFGGTERDGCRHADLGVWETLMFLLEAVVVAVHRPRRMHDFPTRARFEIPAERPAFQESLGNPKRHPNLQSLRLLLKGLRPSLQDSLGNG